jgi:hypothetical protein
MMVDIARFSLLGVLLKLNARPTLALVRDANLQQSFISRLFQSPMHATHM